MVGKVTDADGSTHVRMDRVYRGLPGRRRRPRRAPRPGRRLARREPDAGRARDGRAPPRPSARRARPSPRSPRRPSPGRSPARSGSPRRSSSTPPPAPPRLAWEIVTGGTQADGTPSRLASYVDATSGKVLWREQQIETVDGSGQSLYSGTVPLQLTQSGSTYTLKDPTRGGTYTTDLNNKEDSLFCQIFGVRLPDGDHLHQPGHAPSAPARRAAASRRRVDAQYGTNETWDYYNQVHGRNGIFGTGAGSYNRTHYGSGYVNAFWDGTKMTYGDGDGTSYGPLVSLDVAGHEMSHGVTENSANLSYDGESGGLNEATSDIFGTMVEFFANNAERPGRLPDR